MNLVNVEKQQRHVKVTTVNQDTGDIVADEVVDIGNTRGVFVFTIKGSDKMTYETYHNIADQISKTVDDFHRNTKEIFSMVLPDVVTLQYIKL